MRRIPILLSSLVFLSIPAAAQELVPPAFAGWTSAGAERFRPDSFEQLVGEDAAVLREYGALFAERRAYSRAGESLTVVVYRMRDPTAAYGAFSFLRSRGVLGAEPGESFAMSRRRTLAVTGNLLLDVSGANLSPYANDMKSLVAQLARNSDQGPYPNLWQYLPQRGLLPSSVCYLMGPVALYRALPVVAADWIGFADGAEAQIARYRKNGEELSLLLVLYPTPQVAARRLDELSRRFDLNGGTGATNRQPPLFASRAASLVALVAGTRSRNLAESLLKEIRYETQITWNEPGKLATEPAFSQMILGVFIGTGIILLFTFIAGLAFGGVRLIVKRLLPGMVFDRPDRLEILQLGLNSKPIEAKDFY